MSILMERPAQGGDRQAHSIGREEPGCSGRSTCSGRAWADLPTGVKEAKQGAVDFLDGVGTARLGAQRLEQL